METDDVLLRERDEIYCASYFSTGQRQPIVPMLLIFNDPESVIGPVMPAPASGLTVQVG